MPCFKTIQTILSIFYFADSKQQVFQTIGFVSFNMSTSANATASKMLTRESSLIHGLRLGGSSRPYCPGNIPAMI
jgi:hypothetical protein